ncbi:MAG: alginate export family protein [Chthonomonas sp.]|nr:alginate export family protein [Chthonomonas sp.]
MSPIDHAAIKHFTVRPILEYRARYERRMDQDFQPDRRDNRSNLLQRGRVGAEMTKDGMTVRLVYQHSSSLNWLVAGNGIAIRSDLLEANVSFKSGNKKVVLGRQRFGLGNRRLIGELDWNNVGNSFEGARVDDRNWTLFLLRSGVQPVPSKGLLLAGASTSTPLSTTSLIVKSDDAKQIHRTRLTLSTEGKSKPVAGRSLTYQVALQAGHEGGKKVQAWAANGRYTADVQKDLEAYGEINIASGGASKGVNSTFDQLYPTAHDKLGLLDTTGWRNVVAASAGLKMKFTKTSSLRLACTWLQLYSSKDAWYGAGGAANTFGTTTYKDPTGNSGKNLGHEFDLEYVTTLKSNLSLSAGCGLFVPGRFVKSFGGSRFGNQTYGYVMLGWRY